MRSGRDLVALLPHRAPLLLLDDAERVEERAIETSQVIPQENLFLSGHFPGFPLWPGALLIEAMAQTTAVYLLQAKDGLKPGEIPVLGAVDCRFFSPVFPGDQIRYRAELVREIDGLGLFSVVATRGTEVVARGRISAGFILRSTLSAPPK